MTDIITQPDECPACGYDGYQDVGPFDHRGPGWRTMKGTCKRCGANWRGVLLLQAREKLAEVTRERDHLKASLEAALALTTGAR